MSSLDMNLFHWALIIFFLSYTFLTVVHSFHVKTLRHTTRTTSTQVFANRNSGASNPLDTSVASRIDDAAPFLQQVGRSYTDKDAWENDIQKLHYFLHHTKYHHSTIKKNIFNLTINEGTDDVQNQKDDQSVEKYQYPFGPTYVRPISSGQSIDLRPLIDVNSTIEWMPSLQVLTTLFLLSSCVPLPLFIQTVVGGEDTLNLLLRLGLIYLSSDGETNKDGEWVVPVVHLFPLQLPQLPGAKNLLENYIVEDMIFMTDLHPNVLSMTTIPTTGGPDSPDEGAVMYIGPDSLALVQHLHASFVGYINSVDLDRPIFRILDVCCGSGVQALATLGMLDVLRASGHDMVAVDVQAVAVDVNQRALRFTEFNARLNKMNVTTMQSDILAQDAMSSIEALVRGNEGERRFDILLANPPFIPTPNIVSDDAALSLREPNFIQHNSQSYGLFSSGGVTGEDCLCAIIQMAPRLLRSDGGLLGIVSEFMNPPLSDLDEQKCLLLTKMEQWWGPYHDALASGVLFTNENPLTSQVYAQRRALTDDKGIISLWLNHLEKYQINNVSPGLLFVKYKRKSSNPNNTGCNLGSCLVPKSKQGSLWTPQNFNAVECTMKVLKDLYQS